MQGLMIRPAAGTDDDKKGGETRKARPVRQQGGLSAGRCWEPRITDPAADCGGLGISASNGGRTHRHGGRLLFGCWTPAFRRQTDGEGTASAAAPSKPSSGRVAPAAFQYPYFNIMRSAAIEGISFGAYLKRCVFC